MTYDFTTLLDRRRSGSVKWEMMFEAAPDLPAGIIPFSVADMEFKNAPEIVQGLKVALDDLVLGYTRPTAAYYDAVRAWMARRHDWAIEDAWVLLSPGVVPALFQAVRAYTEPGEAVLVFTPSYYPFYQAIQLNERRLVRSPLQIVEGRYEIDWTDFEAKAADPACRMLLFCSPHNPVGRVWTRAELQKVAAICERHQLVLISDEIHFDLVMPNHRHTVITEAVPAAAEYSVVLTAPSKTFNLAGLQVANLVVPNRTLRQRLQTEQSKQGPSILNALAYRACEIAYTQCDEWYRRMLALIWHNHQLLKDYLAKHCPEIGVFELEGTYLQWLDFRFLGLTAQALAELMQQKAQVFMDEGYWFGLEGAGFERFNLAAPTTAVAQALARMVAAVKAQQALGK